MTENRSGSGSQRTGGELGAEVTWSQLQPILANHFPATAEGRPWREGLKVVEVGCGLGELAYLMQEAGLQVVAIDPSPAVITVARKRGLLDARQCGIEQLARVQCPARATLQLLRTSECGVKQEERERRTFDVVLFTRSLHHIGELSGVLRMVRDDLLRQGGILIIEEFGREDIDRATAEWYYSLHDALAGAGAIDPQLKQSCHRPDAAQQRQKDEDAHGTDDAGEEGDHDTDVVRGGKDSDESLDALTRWERQFRWSHHRMEGIKRLHLGGEMVTTIQDVFGDIELQRCPLLFRFIANHVDRKQHSCIPGGRTLLKEDAAYEIARNVWRWEKHMIKHSQAILPLGILGVATTGRLEENLGRPTGLRESKRQDL